MSKTVSTKRIKPFNKSYFYVGMLNPTDPGRAILVRLLVLWLGVTMVQIAPTLEEMRLRIRLFMANLHEAVMEQSYEEMRAWLLLLGENPHAPDYFTTEHRARFPQLPNERRQTLVPFLRDLPGNLLGKLTEKEVDENQRRRRSRDLLRPIVQAWWHSPAFAATLERDLPGCVYRDYAENEGKWQEADVKLAMLHMDPLEDVYISRVEEVMENHGQSDFVAVFMPTGQGPLPEDKEV